MLEFSALAVTIGNFALIIGISVLFSAPLVRKTSPYFFGLGFAFFVDQIKVHFVQDKNAVDNLKEASKNCAYIDNIFYVEMTFHIVCFITMIYTICVSVKARNSLYPKQNQFHGCPDWSIPDRASWNRFKVSGNFRKLRKTESLKRFTRNEEVTWTKIAKILKWTAGQKFHKLAHLCLLVDLVIPVLVIIMVSFFNSHLGNHRPEADSYSL